MTTDETPENEPSNLQQKAKEQELAKMVNAALGDMDSLPPAQDSAAYFREFKERLARLTAEELEKIEALIKHHPQAGMHYMNLREKQLEGTLTPIELPDLLDLTQILWGMYAAPNPEELFDTDGMYAGE